MTKRSPHRPNVQQIITAERWRSLVGPGHQFPVMTDKVLNYWPGQRRP